jgi:protein O-mannosyl-transferase
MNPSRAHKLVSDRIAIGLAMALFILGIGVFWPATANGFIEFDDPDYVRDNAHLREGVTVRSLTWAFADTQQAGFWHPVTWISHLVDYELFDDNPYGHHAMSVGLHALNMALLFGALVALTKALWKSFGVAVLFGVHPLRVESVAWVAERKDILCATFALLSLAAYARFATATRPSRERAWYLVSLGCFALGGMAKPMIVTLPFVFLLLDYWPLQRTRTMRWGKRIREKIVFAMAAIAISATAFLAQHAAGAVAIGVPVMARLDNAVVSYARYLGHAFFPVKLAVFYPHPDYWPAGEVTAAAALLLTISWAVYRWRKTRPYLIAGWLWFVAMLLPVIGLLQVGEQSMADRFTYLPSVGLAIAVVWGASELLGGRRARAWSIGILATVTIAAAMTTRREIAYWRSNETLFRRALAVTGENHVAHQCLGIEYERAGRLADAAAEYHAVLELKPRYAPAHLNLGYVLAPQQNFAWARAELEEAERLRADRAKTRFGFGLCLAGEEHFAEAANAFSAATKIRPDWSVAHHNLAMALLRTGRVDLAIAELQAVVALDPSGAAGHSELGAALANVGRVSEGVSELRRAVKLAPSSVESRLSLANALARNGALPEATTEFRAIATLSPQLPEAHNNLGLALAMQGDVDEARREFCCALALRPNYPTAQRNLEGLSSGTPRSAAAALRDATAIRP